MAAGTRRRTASASTLLLLPDLLAYWLTGERGAERTNASTTQLYDATTREWALPLLEDLGLRTDLLPPLRDPGDVIGTLLPDGGRGGRPARGVPGDRGRLARHRLGRGRGPARRRPSAYLSSGTWSLVGLELPGPS